MGESIHVAPNDVCFYIHFISWFERSQSGVFSRVWNEGYNDLILIDLGNGE